MKDEPKVSSLKVEEKKENKLAGDSGYDCNYCHGKYHFAKDCMLRKIAEKREGEDDETYYMRKLEVKQKKASNSSMNALIVQENAGEDEFGGVEVWSTDSEDEEVRGPTHGKAFAAKNEGSGGKCFIVTHGPSTENADTELNLTYNKCFSAKPVSEKINDCDRLIKKEDDVIAECESEVSSEETSMSYRLGFDKIETFIDSKEHKSMLKDILDENDSLKTKTETIQTFDESNAKIVKDNKINLDNLSEFDAESEMSEILVEDVVDCSKFVKNETKNDKPLISENSVEFARLSKKQKPKLKEKALVYQKVQTVTNQVYDVTGVTQGQTVELRIMVDKDNAEGCKDYFWSAPIDNADETVGLSEKTTWRVKGRYILEPINKPSSFDIPSTS
uniref:Uncharacterized protein n=1 Tax=Lactuca sativa TaxID=4236 RepID=A0A9R1UU57_LACSA|nr:hypothetical protein LSAT_V11C800452020 [Lactuca sativa]